MAHGLYRLIIYFFFDVHSYVEMVGAWGTHTLLLET